MSENRKMWITVGLPGCGKSWWCWREACFLPLRRGPAAWHSRDEVRFQMAREDEEYFSHEEEVFQTWTQNIQQSLNNSSISDIYVDATHLTKASRKKLLHALTIPKDVEIIWVVFDVPLEVCRLRNAMRTGRQRVPEEIIKSMVEKFTYPIDGNKVIVIDKDGKEVI